MPEEEPGVFRRHKLGLGAALYAAAALADAYMTLSGVGSDLQLEGNPLMRGMMERIGAELGLVTQKAAIGAATILIAVVGERAIRLRKPWIWRIPMTRWVRSWMRRKDRSWIAFIPLYAATMGQGFAALSWVALAFMG
jgi:hypothetical protein